VLDSYVLVCMALTFGFFKRLSETLDTT
jgi:hypothetical protein